MRHSRVPWIAVLLVCSCLAAGILAVPASAGSEGYLRYPGHPRRQGGLRGRGRHLDRSGQGGTPRGADDRTSAESPSPSSRRTGDGSPSPASTTAMPTSSSSPPPEGSRRRLTWHPGGDEVIGWTPDGESVIFRSCRERSASARDELFLVPAEGGDVDEAAAGLGRADLDIDPDSGRWAFTRTQRERRTWKRYRGGTATRIWVGDPNAADYRQVTRFAGMNAFPMWHDGRIYFLSDQGGTANIWSMQADGADRQQAHRLRRVGRALPLDGTGRANRLHARPATSSVFDPADGSERKLEIDAAQRPGADPRALPRRRTLRLTWFDLSPDGERLAVTARGEIFSVPVEEGRDPARHPRQRRPGELGRLRSGRQEAGLRHRRAAARRRSAPSTPGAAARPQVVKTAGETRLALPAASTRPTASGSPMPTRPRRST